MTYTRGIRKILDVPGHYGHIERLFEVAKVTGHEAVTHNGDIYVLSKDGEWVKTPFHIHDFEVELGGVS